MGAKKDRFRERGREQKKLQKRRLYSLAFFSCPFFVLSSLFLTRQSDIETKSSFSFSNKLKVFSSLRKALLVACAHNTAQRAIFRDTNTPELAHAHKYTRTHKKGTNNFLSLFIPLSLSLFFSPLECFSSSRVQRQNAMMMMMIRCLSRGPISRSRKFKSSSSRGNEEKEERDTSNEKTQSAQ